ncbi:hypothetical protein EMMF5_004998 [Cystobasidiomycetes sp. EMM_F5]
MPHVSDGVKLWTHILCILLVCLTAMHTVMALPLSSAQKVSVLEQRSLKALGDSDDKIWSPQARAGRSIVGLQGLRKAVVVIPPPLFEGKKSKRQLSLFEESLAELEALSE